jgi:hypothetical protein
MFEHDDSRLRCAVVRGPGWLRGWGFIFFMFMVLVFAGKGKQRSGVARRSVSLFCPLSLVYLLIDLFDEVFQLVKLFERL